MSASKERRSSESGGVGYMSYAAQTTVMMLVTAGAFAVVMAFAATVFSAFSETPDGSYVKFGYTKFLAFLGIGIPICVMAYITGYLTVYSRTSAVGNVLPAVLALVGGVNIYVFGTDNAKKGVVGYCVFLFASLVFLGTQDGAQRREAERVPRLEALANQERKIRNFRENLGLSADPPPWIVSTEPR